MNELVAVNHTQPTQIRSETLRKPFQEVSSCGVFYGLGVLI